MHIFEMWPAIDAFNSKSPNERLITVRSFIRCYWSSIDRSKNHATYSTISNRLSNWIIECMGEAPGKKTSIPNSLIMPRLKMTTQTVCIHTLSHSLILSLSLFLFLTVCLSVSHSFSLIYCWPIFIFSCYLSCTWTTTTKKPTFICVNRLLYNCQYRMWTLLVLLKIAPRCNTQTRICKQKTMSKYHLLLSRVIVPRQRLLVLYSFCAKLFISSFVFHFLFFFKETVIWIHYLLPLVYDMHVFVNSSFLLFVFIKPN